MILHDGGSMKYVPMLFWTENGACKNTLKWSILAGNGTKMRAKNRGF